MRPVALFYIFISLFNVGQIQEWLDSLVCFWIHPGVTYCFVKIYEEIMASHRYVCNWKWEEYFYLAFLVTVDILGIISKFNKQYFLKKLIAVWNRKLSTLCYIKIHCSILRFEWNFYIMHWSFGNIGSLSYSDLVNVHTFHYKFGRESYSLI